MNPTYARDTDFWWMWHTNKSLGTRTKCKCSSFFACLFPWPFHLYAVIMLWLTDPEWVTLPNRCLMNIGHLFTFTRPNESINNKLYNLLIKYTFKTFIRTTTAANLICILRPNDSSQFFVVCLAHVVYVCIFSFDGYLC